ncbi:MAG: cyclic nucleotide-binding domain-containing protein [Thermodesulfobacteriota bacterium]|nr:cyclic nucleotide-binding domain-containing protein [Thermodesulfobacteriota bacterium]
MKEAELLFKKFGHNYPAGTVLFQEGQPCTEMFIIQKGRVRLFKKIGVKEFTIDLLGPGDFFGEMACLVDQPRAINAVVDEDSDLLLIESEVITHLFRENTGMGLKVLTNLASRLRKAYGIIEGLIEEVDQLRERRSG